MNWFKTMTANEYIRRVKEHGWTPFSGKFWQRNYYEHVIRNEDELNKIQEYIDNNPAQWALDRENPEADSGRPGPAASKNLLDDIKIIFGGVRP